MKNSRSIDCKADALTNASSCWLRAIFKTHNCHRIRFGTLNVESLCGRKTEVCEGQRKRRVDVCCMQEVRWKGQRVCFVGTLGGRCKLWWSGNDAGFGGVGILVKRKYLECCGS